jgi:hypothetical protein
MLRLAYGEAASACADEPKNSSAKQDEAGGFGSGPNGWIVGDCHFETTVGGVCPDGEEIRWQIDERVLDSDDNHMTGWINTHTTSAAASCLEASCRSEVCLGCDECGAGVSK